MDTLMTKEESYAERRKLFKNIWETAMTMDEKDPDIMNKPKVIRTLRLDEVDKINIGKNKKQRIKNLRNVCNRLLDYCDRQDADDVLYEQMASAVGGRPSPAKPGEAKPKKTKFRKKRAKKAKSYAPAGDNAQANPTSSDRREGLSRDTRTSKVTTPNVLKRTTIVKKSTNAGIKNLNPKSSPSPTESPTNFPGDATARRRVVKKKQVKRKKISVNALPAGKIKIN